MGKKIFITMLVAMLCGSQVICMARRKEFEGHDHTVVYKGESVFGLGATYWGVNTDNSDILTIVSGLTAKAEYYKIAPYYAYAYTKNQLFGIRGSYSNIRGGAEKMDVDLLGLMSMKDMQVDVNSRSYGAAIFNRSFIGLDRKGNVGLYCEVALSYKNSHTGMSGADSYTQGHNVRLSFSPGVLLYIVPNASLNVQLGIANADWKKSTVYENGAVSGSMQSIKGGVKLSLMDMMFGVNYHF